MKIYTKTGDAGETGLYGGGRVAKDSPRIEAIGAVDELAAALAVSLSCEEVADELRTVLETIQHQLFDLGSALACSSVEGKTASAVGARQISFLENSIDRCEEPLDPLTQFILPGGSPTAARLQFARSVCRRAERRVVTLGAAERVAPELVVYLNRLSDLLFVMARRANQLANVADVPWRAGE